MVVKNQQSALVEYAEWMKVQVKSGHTEERTQRLGVHHGHAKRLFALEVWWPAFSSFTGLVPEFAIRDFKDGWRYLDFVYQTPWLKLCIEIDGYGPHAKDISKQQFADNLMRQNHLVIDGWVVIRFSYDDLVERPRQCQQLLLQLLGKWSLSKDEKPLRLLHPLEKSLLRLFISHSKPLSPVSISQLLGIHRRTAARHLKSLLQSDYLHAAFPVQGTRVSAYVLNSAKVRFSDLLSL